MKRNRKERYRRRNLCLFLLFSLLFAVCTGICGCGSETARVDGMYAVESQTSDGQVAALG